MTKVSYSRDGVEYALEVETLPATAIAYLLQYGFAQSLQDSIAGRAKAVRDELTTKPEGAAGDWQPPSEAAIAEAIKSDLAGTLAKRMDAISRGEVASRGQAEPKDPAAGIVRELLVAYAKSKGKKLPKADSDEYKAMAAKMREAKAEWIAAELARRAAVADEIDIDL